MIDLHSVSAGYPGIKLLKNFNWHIEAGENWLIQGPNGSGKTLLLELLAGKIHPTDGEVRIDFIDGKTWTNGTRNASDSFTTFRPMLFSHC